MPILNATNIKLHSDNRGQNKKKIDLQIIQKPSDSQQFSHSFPVYLLTFSPVLDSLGTLLSGEVIKQFVPKSISWSLKPVLYVDGLLCPEG